MKIYSISASSKPPHTQLILQQLLGAYGDLARLREMERDVQSLLDKDDLDEDRRDIWIQVHENLNTLLSAVAMDVNDMTSDLAEFVKRSSKPNPTRKSVVVVKGS